VPVDQPKFSKNVYEVLYLAYVELRHAASSIIHGYSSISSVSVYCTCIAIQQCSSRFIRDRIDTPGRPLLNPIVHPRSLSVLGSTSSDDGMYPPPTLGSWLLGWRVPNSDGGLAIWAAANFSADKNV
jgi:hypothetical protein